jgi:4'-phosphopantetheinyl transferase
MLPCRALTDFETITAECLECPDTIDIWWWPVGESEPDWREVETSLPGEERRRAEAILQPADRKVFMAGRYLQRDVLGAHLGMEKQELRFIAGPHGKPMLAAPKPVRPLAFNLTNTRRLAVLAVSRLPLLLGIDAEETSETIDLDDARIFCCENELQLLSGLRPAERKSLGLLYWILKESALKAVGTGLQLSPAGLEIIASSGEAVTIRGLPPPGADTVWWHGLFSLAGKYRIAVSAGGCAKPPRIRQRRFSPQWHMTGY